MASCTLSASTMRNSGQYEPPISRRPRLPEPAAGVEDRDVLEFLVVERRRGRDHHSAPVWMRFTPEQAVSGGVRVARYPLAALGVPLQPATDPQPGQRLDDIQGDGAMANYGFSHSVNSVPLVAAEFPLAAEYAIVFAGNADEVMPVVILGARDEENLYLSEEGEWRAKYILAFLRR
jgi:hypothetical protein